MLHSLDLAILGNVSPDIRVKEDSAPLGLTSGTIEA